MSNQGETTPQPLTDDWQDTAVDVDEDEEPSVSADNVESAVSDTNTNVASAVETTPSNENSEGSADSSGMGSFVDIDAMENVPYDVDSDSRADSPFVVLIQESENEDSKKEEDISAVNDVPQEESQNVPKEETKNPSRRTTSPGAPDPSADASTAATTTPSRSTKIFELRQRRLAAAAAASAAESARPSPPTNKEENLSAELTLPEEKDAVIVDKEAQNVVDNPAMDVVTVSKDDVTGEKVPDSPEEEKDQVGSTDGNTSMDVETPVEHRAKEEKEESPPTEYEQQEEQKEQESTVEAASAERVGGDEPTGDGAKNEEVTNDTKSVEQEDTGAAEVKDTTVNPLPSEEADTAITPSSSTPRSQNHRMKHVNKLRQKYQPPTKLNSESNENLAVEAAPSTITSASQATARHHNGMHKTTVPSASSNVSCVSDASSFGIDEVDSALCSASYLKEKERLRLRKIALEAVAGPMSMNATGAHMATLKEAKSSGSASLHENDRFDPYACNSSKSPSPEIEMRTIGRDGKNEVNSTPAQLQHLNVDIIKSNNSSSSARTQTFDNLAPIRTDTGFVDIGRLIVVGVAGLIGGVMLSTFALNTCEFVTIKKKVGYYNETLIVHAGMSSFTSMDSVFLGGTACMSYDHAYYGQEAPVFAKTTAMLALVCGVISVSIVWFYNFTTRTTVQVWNTGTVLAGMASVLQLLTFQFFFGAVCNGEDCSVGSGSLSSFMSVCTYGYMAFEMNRNCPVQRIILPGMVTDLIEKGELFVKGKNEQFARQRTDYSAPNIV